MCGLFLAGLASYYVPSRPWVLRALSRSPASSCAYLRDGRATARTATSTSTSRRATRTVHSCLQRPFGSTAATSGCWHETLARVGARDSLGDKCACDIYYVQDINRAKPHCTLTLRDHRVRVEDGLSCQRTGHIFIDLLVCRAQAVSKLCAHAAQVCSATMKHFRG